MATVQQILTAAYSHSTKNAPGRIMAESTEGLEVVTRAIRGLFSFGARLNREFFATSEVVEIGADPVAWARPDTAESIFRLEFAEGDNAGTEVVVVPMSDRMAEALLPAVYRWGQAYYSAGNVFDPTDEDISFFFSKRPDTPATLEADIDPLWPEAYNELLALEVAIYIAIKDNRGEEVKALMHQRDKWLQIFVAFLEHEDVGERRRFDHDRRFNAATMVPLQQLLAGGSNLNLG